MSERKRLSIEEARLEPAADASRVQQRALIIGAVGGLATVAGYFLSSGHPADFYRAYLIGWLLWLGVATGLFALSMLNHVAGGQWGVLMRRVMEASGRTLPFFFLLGLPILFGLENIYPWAVPGAAEHDALIQHKEAYLNVGFFQIRFAAYFVLWSILAYSMSSLSRRHDETGDPAYLKKMQRLSAGGLVLYVLSGTFASVDWLMSLDPHWFSSLFGAAFVVGHGLSGLAFAIPVLLFLSRREPHAAVVKAKHFHDYGKLMLAFVVLWAYMMVSQFLIIWSGNLPEEITFYLERNANGWKEMSIFLVIGHFAIPFFLLLSRDLKRTPGRLIYLCFWILAMRWLDFFWQVAPSLSHEGIRISWIDFAVPLGIGGLWIWLLFGQLKKGAVLPVREPILEEMMAHD